MRFLIIIPAHNEEDSILLCLNSLAKQTYQNFNCIIVNDGSTDKTKELVENFIKKNTSFRLKNLDTSFHQPGAKVVQTFYQGLEEVSLADYDVICKFDADIIFPPQYLENINKVYKENPKTGMVSGLVYIQNDKGEWVYENLSSKYHVRGPIKSYRKDCFFAMNGLRPVLGWDNIDVMLTQMNGYETVTIKNIWVKHLRPTAYKYKSQKAEKLGEYFYNIGLNLPLAMISSAKSSFKNRSFSEFFITMKSFLSQNKPLQLTQEEIKFIRNLRNPLQKILNKQ
ncbi:glycosyltransferase family 2 protein [Riemerella anatipestifer]|uniref:glycosyltransferase family 2 protein n=1 Tax=Riemerella anatipestifer TaxID=34085 RepID=UPI00069C3485|nr:glycosyltransferase family 2 protein [Riemerella anatipestifer]